MPETLWCVQEKDNNNWTPIEGVAGCKRFVAIRQYVNLIRSIHGLMNYRYDEPYEIRKYWKKFKGQARTVKYSPSRRGGGG